MSGILARSWALMGLAAVCLMAQAPGFKVARQFPVPGDGGFDYIVFDGSSNRLYVSHGTKVDVLDAASGAVLGKVEDTPGVHGIAIVAKLHRGFATNGGDATVSVFDTNTFRTLKKIPVAKGPDFVFYDPHTGRVLVCHGDAAQITAIDPVKQVVVGKIDLGGGAEAAVVGGTGAGFVNLEEAATVVRFDPLHLTARERWPITGCSTPTGLAMDTKNARLFIGCRSRVLAVMDANNGKVVATLPIGERVDAVVFDASSGLIFTSNGGGTISVIRQKSANSYESAGEITTQPSAKTMAFDPATKRLFLSAAEMEPAAATSGKRARMRPKPGTFKVLVVE